jgi:hypothetical protein
MSKALVVADKPGPLALPDFVKSGSTRGREDITRDDLVLPRLAVAQPTSPELVDGDPKYIDGLRSGDLFNTLTKESYGKGPVQVVVLRAERPRAIEFNPLTEGGGIKDMNVPINDPRCSFGADGEKPSATVFREFIAFLVESREPIALSFKGTSLKTGKELATFIQLRNADAFTTIYAITANLKKNDKGSFYVFRAMPAGNVDEDTYHYAEQLFTAFGTKELAVDVEAAVSSEDVPF